MSLDYKKNEKCIYFSQFKMYRNRYTREREQKRYSVREKREKYRAREKKQFQVIGKQIPEFEN